jgi:hypothetical protein
LFVSVGADVGKNEQGYGGGVIRKQNIFLLNDIQDAGFTQCGVWKGLTMMEDSCFIFENLLK